MSSLRQFAIASLLGLWSVTALVAGDAPALPAAGADGFITIFNGTDLTNWDGLPEYWSVKDGVISGHETKDASKQTFLIFSHPVANFELHCKYRFATPDGNSGIQFRSKVMDAPSFRVGGYQADFDAGRGYDGSIYDEGGIAGGRNTMSNRGEKTVWDANTQRHNEPLSENSETLKNLIKSGDWNDVVLVARGNHVIYSINGHVTTDQTDESPKALSEGVIAFQLHAGFTMEVQFKDIKIKIFK